MGKSRWGNQPFSPWFQSKPEMDKRALILHKRLYPVATSHLAAIKIQQWIRRQPVKHNSFEITQHKMHQRIKARDSLYMKYHKETGGIVNSSDPKFQAWCQTRIARCWRNRRYNKHQIWKSYAVYHHAQRSIRSGWGNYLIQSNRKNGPKQHHHACQVIQRSWRTYTQKKIFRYFRDLVYLRQNSNPISVLKALSPQEAALMDKASGMYLRFRLGGKKFPPLIYYKVYTARNVTDLGAFAPRNYTLEGQVASKNTYLSVQMQEAKEEELKKYWYQRVENNGWRVITDCSSLDPEAEEQNLYHKADVKSMPYHHSKLVRQVDLLKKRKRKKLQWIKKMYQLGKETEEDNEIQQEKEEVDEYTAIAEQIMQIDETSDELFNVDWEDEADNLLQWTQNLNFESYQDSWFSSATTRPIDVYLQDQEAEIEREVQELAQQAVY